MRVLFGFSRSRRKKLNGDVFRKGGEAFGETLSSVSQAFCASPLSFSFMRSLDEGSRSLAFLAQQG